jgi:hypothetical protein
MIEIRDASDPCTDPELLGNPGFGGADSARKRCAMTVPSPRIWHLGFNLGAALPRSLSIDANQVF